MSRAHPGAGGQRLAPGLAHGYGLAFGRSERKAMTMGLVDRALQARERGERVRAPAQDEEYVVGHLDGVRAAGFLEHLQNYPTTRQLPGRARDPAVIASTQ
ncbi:MAG: carbon-phosphorus lyase complex subunit PhnI [Arhodomonas sp.]|nr:carbon-phosphorus lyase complex subunit PhnI [Arhodomonas sp.]